MRESIITKTHSTYDTEALGAHLAKEMQSDSSIARFVAFYGDLGVGKTAFIRGFVSIFAPCARVKSPTFALVNEYRATDGSVFHFDMYRIESEDDLYSIGFYDYLSTGSICLVEWSENIPYAIPEHHVRVTIAKTESDGTDTRSIKIEFQEG